MGNVPLYYGHGDIVRRLIEHLEALEEGRRAPSHRALMREDGRFKPGRGMVWGTLPEVLKLVWEQANRARGKYGMEPLTRAQVLEGLRRLREHESGNVIMHAVQDALGCVRRDLVRQAFGKHA